MSFLADGGEGELSPIRRDGWHQLSITFRDSFHLSRYFGAIRICRQAPYSGVAVHAGKDQITLGSQRWRDLQRSSRGEAFGPARDAPVRGNGRAPGVGSITECPGKGDEILRPLRQ